MASPIPSYWAANRNVAASLMLPQARLGQGLATARFVTEGDQAADPDLPTYVKSFVVHDVCSNVVKMDSSRYGFCFSFFVLRICKSDPSTRGRARTSCDSK